MAMDKRCSLFDARGELVAAYSSLSTMGKENIGSLEQQKNSEQRTPLAPRKVAENFSTDDSTKVQGKMSKALRIGSKRKRSPPATEEVHLREPLPVNLFFSRIGFDIPPRPRPDPNLVKFQKVYMTDEESKLLERRASERSQWPQAIKAQLNPRMRRHFN
uniref:Uncharacterized protein n=2 Tax=Rhodosorus marinus TaxID=101924 RepID=A0A7S2ZNL3_9RHOD|mmetsp:Transcript_23406/g.92975  ORF Transcript_23406/g.92975 Transcript_23406/m.92975 type:complete len:160 (+) Transcript_23406:270-749(+)